MVMVSQKRWLTRNLNTRM